MPGRFAYAIGTVAFVAAMLAKPQAAALPLVALAMAPLLPRRSAWRVIPWFILAIPIAIIAHHVQPAPRTFSPLFFRPIVALDDLAFYIGKLLWPFHLANDYGRYPRWLLNSPQRWWTWAAPIVLMMIAMKFRRRAPWLLAALLIFAAALLPVLGLAPFAFQIFSTPGDHYVYVAMLGPALIVAWLTSRCDSKRWLAPIAAVLLALALLSGRQTLFWTDTHSLFQHTLEATPTSLVANSTLGYYFEEHGDDAQAAGYFNRAVQYHPEAPDVQFDYANLLRKHQALDAALEHYQSAIALDPNNADYEMNFGVALAMAQRRDEALAAFIRAATISPSNPDALQDAGIELAKMGRPAEARSYLLRALECDPSRTRLRDLMNALPATSPATARTN